MKQHTTIFFCCLLMFFSLSCSTNKTTDGQEEQKSTSASMAAWQNHKFSMFIHWGLYSIPAGVWNGEQITGYSEQIQGHARISKDEYTLLAQRFNPVNWNADSVALLAKQAGMKAIVITAKHHDGFNMYDTKYSDYNVVDATPYKRDVIKELSEACKRHDLKLGLYFSLIDWNYPGAKPFTSVRNSDSIPAAHHQYNLHQIEELLTNYGAISELWFDMSSPTCEQSKEMARLVKRLQPDCLISGRIWNDQGDFAVMGDNKSPEFQMGTPWQTPASMFDETWGYRSWQKRGDVKVKAKDKIRDLVNIVSMGGNYLLNIGPTGDGKVIPFEKQVLTEMGKWLKVNGEAVYGTSVSPVPSQEWGVITAKPGKLYLHVNVISDNKKLVLKGFNSKIKRIYPLANPSIRLNGTQDGDNLVIDLSDINASEFVTVFVIEYAGDLQYTPERVVRDNKAEFILTAENGTSYHSYSGHDYYSLHPTVVKIGWYLPKTDKSEYMLELSYTKAHLNKELRIDINGQEYFITPDENNYLPNEQCYRKQLGSVKLGDAAFNLIELNFKDQSNPHKDLNAEGLTLRLTVRR
ncbi:alpha-L-fucosidase [Marinilabiliaceae bacterium JC017]|nr:alpha-L-fucosidase [Marinilabiliaceae bacterium JC017]